MKRKAIIVAIGSLAIDLSLAFWAGYLLLDALGVALSYKGGVACLLFVLATRDIRK